MSTSKTRKGEGERKEREGEEGEGAKVQRKRRNDATHEVEEERAGSPIRRLKTSSAFNVPQRMLDKSDPRTKGAPVFACPSINMYIDWICRHVMDMNGLNNIWYTNVMSDQHFAAINKYDVAQQTPPLRPTSRGDRKRGHMRVPKPEDFKRYKMVGEMYDTRGNDHPQTITARQRKT